jgi:hypothetical protein
VTAIGVVTEITSDSGNAIPSSGIVTISGGTTGLTTSASSATLNLTGTLKLANGGTNASLTASNGGIFYSTSTAGAILSGTATANQVLMSGSSTTPAWSTATYPATTTINQLLYSSANSVVGGVTAGNYGVLISSSSGVPSWLANGTTGQVLTATTSGTPSWAAASGGGFTWNNVTGSTQVIVAGNGYISNSASVAFTLPTVAAVGTVIAIQGSGLGSWSLAQNASQQIIFNQVSSTSGTGGSVSSTGSVDGITLICVTANDTWVVNQSIGNLSVV